MSDKPSPSAAPLEEQLVAYLDGELDAESGRRIEEQLAADPRARRMLQGLERTWELLDDLDAPPVGERFTQTTLEMVAVAVRSDVRQSLAEAPRRRRRCWLIAAGGVLAAAASGFLAVAIFASDPNKELIQDLPVLENLDEYRQVESVEFLQKLRAEGLFSKENGEPSSSVVSAGAPRTDETPARRRQRVESMSPSDKEQLLRLDARFAAIDPAEQQQLRQLHEQLQRDPDAERLRQLMHRYCEWLKTLPAYSRAELADLNPADSVKWIKKRVQEDARDSGKRLEKKDAETLLRWMNQCMARQEAGFLQTMPEQQRKKLTEMSPPMRHRLLIWQVLQRWQATGGNGPPPMMTNEDLVRLRTELSGEARQRLAAMPVAEQWPQVAAWTRHALRQKVGGKQGHGPASKADDERLLKFFEHELTDAERDRLLNMPGEEMQRELQRLYLTRTKPPEGTGRRPEGSRRGNRPGGERPSSKKIENGSKAPERR